MKPRRIFLDINVILDILTQRQPHYAASAKLYGHIEEGTYQGLFSVLSLGTVYCILSSHCGKAKAVTLLKLLRDVLELVEAPTQTANLALDSEWADFEDALQYYSAVHAHANCIVTRNPKDFKKSQLAIYTPEEFLELQKEA